MHEEIDLLELGIMPARCLKGENDHEQKDPRKTPERIIISRYHRGMRDRKAEQLRQNFGKKLPWATVSEAQAKEAIETRIRKLEREKEAAIRSLREYHDRRETERRRLVRRLVAMEKEKGHLKATIRILASDS
jgi:hypothetical protein